MKANKTKATELSVEGFLGALEPARRRDADTLVALMRKVTGEPPRMWGGSIVGFGTHHYRYASGREGEICLLGFSPRKTSFSLYLAGGLDSSGDLLEKLGKHERAKGCLYLGSLAGVDLGVLERLLRRAVEQRSGA